ncbi:hypothetical protein AB3662_06860 [Sorangium cellulosum]|uniref:hypothetical protein n=1 Tax=Sorangium cellulosum TaxID=56 RepID=UPI003D9A8DDE
MPPGATGQAGTPTRHTDLLADYPRLRAYYDRALARPAWQRTLERYPERLGVTVADSR